MPKPFDKYINKWDSPKCKHVRGQLRNAELWKKFKTEFNEETQPQEPCTCMRELRPYSDYPTRITLVTAADSDWFSELQNFVGSVHFWEPRMSIAVYDLGLIPSQLQEIATWRNVVVWPFYESCAHVESSNIVHGSPQLCNKHIKRGSWRPFVLLHAALTDGEFLFLSAGHELRNILEPLALQLYRDSVFSVTVTHDITRFADERMLRAVGADRDFFEFKPVCSPGVFGYVCSVDILRRVLLPAAACARNYDDCWSLAHKDPDPPSKQVISTDDLVLSAVLLNNTCYTCNRDLPYYAYRGGSDPTRKTPATLQEHMLRDVDVLYNRQQRSPKPYTEYLVKN